MRNIIKETRFAISGRIPLVEDGAAPSLGLAQNFGRINRGGSEVIAGIPRRNYQDLPRLVPISWL